MDGVCTLWSGAEVVETKHFVVWQDPFPSAGVQNFAPCRQVQHTNSKPRELPHSSLGYQHAYLKARGPATQEEHTFFSLGFKFRV